MNNMDFRDPAADEDKQLRTKMKWVYRLVLVQFGLLVLFIVAFAVVGAVYSHPIKNKVDIIENVIDDLPSIQKQIDKLLPEAHTTLQNVQAQMHAMVPQVQLTLTHMNTMLPQVEQTLAEVQQTNAALCQNALISCGS